MRLAIDIEELDYFSICDSKMPRFGLSKAAIEAIKNGVELTDAKSVEAIKNGMERTDAESIVPLDDEKDAKNTKEEIAPTSAFIACIIFFVFFALIVIGLAKMVSPGENILGDPFQSSYITTAEESITAENNE